MPSNLGRVVMDGTYSAAVREDRRFPAFAAGERASEQLGVLNAILYVAEQGCKWRGLPGRFGNWHTIYVRMNRWAKSGVLDRVFEKLQLEQIVRIKIEAFALDSTSVKVHPDGTGALKKRTAGHWQVTRRMEHQNSYGFRE